MSSKKKLIISLCSFALVCVAAIVGVVGVFAAQTTKVNNRFSISYTASNVHAEVSAKYAIKTTTATVKEENLIVGGDTSATKITFDGEEKTGTSDTTKEFDAIESLTLNDEQHLEFVYTIKNTDTEGGSKFSVGLETNPDEETDNLTYTYAVKVNGTAVTSPAPTYNVLVAELAADATAEITITISITDRDSDVTLSNKSLSFVLQRIHA